MGRGGAPDLKRIGIAIALRIERGQGSSCHDPNISIGAKPLSPVPWHMKYISFKILFICIFLPPVCYILTIQLLENYFQGREPKILNRLLVQNYDALFEGRYTLQEEIASNIGAYLSKSLKYKIGLSARILVKTGQDRVLYPHQDSRDLKGFEENDEFSVLPTETLNYMKVASENYRMLNEGLVLSVSVSLKNNSWISNSILVFYIFIAALILQRCVSKGIKESEMENAERNRRMRHLQDQLDQSDQRLKEVEDKKNQYIQQINTLREGKDDLSKDVNGLLEEIERLEEGLKEQVDVREKVELEVSGLREELDRLKKKSQRPKQWKKKTEATRKRFRVLYKDLDFTDKAIEGYLSLTDDFQLKAEEIIHKLNDDESQVPVKRKVFGKGGKMNVLEVLFSYSGRVYYRRDSQTRASILAIGTKNTQEKDLTFLESLDLK